MNKKILKKKVFIAIFIFLAIFLAFLFIKKSKDISKLFHFENNTYYNFKIENGSKYFSVYKNGSFQEMYLKGVNIGSGKPYFFPGELKITYDEYKKWFEYIGEMNCNCIRVYTIQSPDFYKALYKYNKSHKNNPLYLFQGTWYNEEYLYSTYDVFDENLYNDLLIEEKNAINVIHGNCYIEAKNGHASGLYLYDVSPWTIGWILGIEPEYDVIKTTNENHKEITDYKGKYLSAYNLQPYEVFWAVTGDYLINYEMEKYNVQRPLSFTNWPTADILEHTSDNGYEDELSLMVENITLEDSFHCGLFASYHVYPYYPNFIYTDPKYKDYINENGEYDTYKAYLLDLLSVHDIPVLISEYGIPSSRGIAHDNNIAHMTQGNNTEDEQGKNLSILSKDIFESGCAGGIIFSWQDEWFKKTWNTDENTNKDRRAYWNDVQTNEQFFGLLSFSDLDSNIILDGEKDDWRKTEPLFEKNGTKLYVKNDSAYIYLCIESNDINFSEDELIISFDITPNSGNNSYKEYTFDRNVDFILKINTQKQTELLVHNYYDKFLFEFIDDDKLTTYKEEKPVTKNDDDFNSIYLLNERTIILDDTNEIIENRIFNTGLMMKGTNNVTSQEYNNIADYNYSSHIFEIRIPYALLNFRDPSTKEIEDDFYINNKFSGMNINDIYIGFENNELISYTWDNWGTKYYKTRLKKSYYYIQKIFAELEL